MWKLLKILPTVVVAGLLFAPHIFSSSVGLAAPAALPNCGNDVVGNSKDASWPDMATSQDADHYYTAIVWSENVAGGTSPGQGKIKLAYSRALTTTRSWSSSVIDSTDTNQNPVLVFDPIVSSTVHIAYERGSQGDREIYYTKCILGSTCSTPLLVSSSASSRVFDLRNPQITVNASSDVVVLYEEFDTSATPQSPQTWLSYGYKLITGTTFVRFEGENVFGRSSALEKSVALAVSGNTLHVAYAEDPSGVITPTWIAYRKMDISRATMDGTNPIAGALTPQASNVFTPTDTYVQEPDFPTIAVLGNTVALAWQLTDISDSTTFYLGYATSADAGATWSPDPVAVGNYWYIPSGTAATNLSAGAPTSADTLLGFSNSASGFQDGVHPDMAIHQDSGVDVIHVAWQQQSQVGGSLQSRTDVMYSYKKGSGAWTGTPILSTDVTGQVTNATDFYGYSEKEVVNGKNIFKLRPKILFGNFGTGDHLAANRLQLMYASYVDSKRQVRYNGWQLGSNFVTPDRSEQDSDCDTIPDATEMPVSSCSAISQSVVSLVSTDTVEYPNCDAGSANPDYVPDYLDTDSDGDGKLDGAQSSGVFLPIILKKA